MKTIGCTPCGIHNWSEQNYMNIEYPKHPGGMPYMVKKITVHIEFDTIEEIKNWWDNTIWPEYEAGVFGASEMRVLGAVDSKAIMAYNHGEPMVVDYSYLGGIYMFDTKGNIRPQNHFCGARKLGDFNKFYNA